MGFASPPAGRRVGRLIAPVLYTYVESPLGELLLAGRGSALAFIGLPRGREVRSPAEGWRRTAGPFEEARLQIAAYFAGLRRAFDLRLDPGGTPFQRAVWERLLAIPYGETLTYGELARRLGRPAAARAVGAANGRNPLPIVIPCHRLLGAGGRLTGYGGGLEAKRALLELERRHGAAGPAASHSRPAGPRR